MPVFEHPNETVFSWAAPPLKFGLGATSEIGSDLAGLGVRRAVIVTDAGLMATGLPGRVADLIHAADIAAEVYDGVHVESTDTSIAAAAAWARRHDRTASWP